MNNDYLRKYIQEYNNELYCESYVVPLLCPVRYCVGVFMYDYDCLILCEYANNKTSAFSRVAEYLDQDKKRILYNTFIMSNFNYCPLILMFCGKDANVSKFTFGICKN